MKKIFSSGVILFILLIVGFLTVSGCGGSSGGDSLSPPTVNVTGTWDTTEYVNATDCQEGYYYDYGVYTATQDAGSNTISVYVPALNKTFNGTVSGNVLKWSGSFPDGTGTTTVSFNLTVDESVTPNTITGTASWSWTDGSYSCSGSTQIDGTKR